MKYRRRRAHQWGGGGSSVCSGHLETFPPLSPAPLEPCPPLLGPSRYSTLLALLTSPGSTGGSCLPPMAPQQLLYLKSLHSVHIGLTRPNLHPDTLATTTPCRVSSWRKCLPRPTGFISCCCWAPLPHTPGSFFPKMCRAQVCGSTWWEHGPADPGVPPAPGPSQIHPAGHAPAAANPLQALGHKHRGNCANLPLPSSLPVLTHPPHTHCLTHSHSHNL